MWKVVIADDEGVILNGLRILVDWKSLDCEIVAEARNGQELLEEIKKKQPDIVVSDIRMPHKTGLDIICQMKEENNPAKFIFISGYEDFSYAQTALSQGAVDYLLKPVRREQLEQSVKKAIGQRNDQSTVELFTVRDNEMREVFQKINDDSAYAEEELYERFVDMNIDVKEYQMLGAAFSILWNGDSEQQMPYEKQELLRFGIYNKIQSFFQNRKEGFVVHKDEKHLNLILLIRDDRTKEMVRESIYLIKHMVEELFPVRLCIGFGFPTRELRLMKQTYKAAKFACDLYYFEEKEVISYEHVHREYGVSFEDFNKASEDVLQAVLGKDETVLQKMEIVLDMIESIHYGNRYAAQNRCLLFVGKLSESLYSYEMLKGNFTIRQDKVQEGIAKQPTYRALKEYLLDYYKTVLLPELGSSMKKREPEEITAAKKYIQENYMNDISLKDLAAIACVSQTYFSSLFKKEAGENYKDYLAKVRMKEAIRLLLKTDKKTYEIAYEVGYNNVKRFVEVFKNSYHMTPVEYRKKNME